MPGMADPNFTTTVTLVCEHNTEGALGIIINRPMDMNLGGLFDQLDLTETDDSLAHLPVLSGGPVACERGFVLHEPGPCLRKHGRRITGYSADTVARRYRCDGQRIRTG